MAFSSHPRYISPPKPQRPLLGPWGRLKKAFQRWRLLREKREVWESFVRVAGIMGLRTDCQQQTDPQKQRLLRIRQIEAELRNLRTTDQ